MKSLVASCLLLLAAIALSECGAIPKESNNNNNESVSSSISTSVSSSSIIPTKEDKKGKKEKMGKVLYTAPYSSVRVSKKIEGKALSPVYTSPQKAGKGLVDGPVLIRDKASTASTTSSTTTSTSSPRTEAPALELVTEKDSSGESGEASGSEEISTSTIADLITQS